MTGFLHGMSLASVLLTSLIFMTIKATSIILNKCLSNPALRNSWTEDQLPSISRVVRRSFQASPQDGAARPSGWVINWPRGRGHYHSWLSQILGFRKSNKTCGMHLLKSKTVSGVRHNTVHAYFCSELCNNTVFGNRMFKQFIWIEVLLWFWETNSKKLRQWC